MFSGLYGKSPSSTAEQISEEIIATAEVIRNFLTQCGEIKNPSRGVFVLAFQQVVDSLIAGLLTDEAFEWLAEQ